MSNVITQVLRDKRVLVVGDTGFLGSWMVRKMRDSEIEVVGAGMGIEFGYAWHSSAEIHERPVCDEKMV